MENKLEGAEEYEGNLFFTKKLDKYKIGGQPVYKLYAPFDINQQKPSIVNAIILPGKGMNIFQLVAYLPNYGFFEMLASPPIDTAEDYFVDDPDDCMGNKSFMVGGAILIPFAGRIRGKLNKDQEKINVQILDKKVNLHANWSSGGNTYGEKIAHHGLILNKSMDKIKINSTTHGSFIETVFNAKDYCCGWPGEALHTFNISLTNDEFILCCTTKNRGKDNLPVSIGWHPYFNIPSKKRAKAQLKFNASSRIKVNNYDDVFPTGEIVSTENTEYDFSTDKERPLQTLYLDDCFTDFQKDNKGNKCVELYDPDTNYGLKVTANHVINAFQFYAPPDKPFIAIEPQMNLPDPFNKSIWKEKDCGVKILKKNEEFSYVVKVQLFCK